MSPDELAACIAERREKLGETLTELDILMADSDDNVILESLINLPTEASDIQDDISSMFDEF
jgi:hypothetical protein